ncbi:ubiquitin-conjugating enzyme/RWD-like protein [Jimgerdemannia flammicorona]|uniref:E2 ubiquitin-conjugating enzyme n=1 Tax=Jimgerdemannia flammicorona TaxID=994334 RepID=A0A433D7A8_9FUNG|nr:ubiquitin-conjugating enzyme/RWD-like protein [Jimgerdemannia flammicorona]
MSALNLPSRVKRELEILDRDLPQGIICYPVDDNCSHFSAQIKGTKGTPYEGGTFKLDIQITSSYPIQPPKVQFVTPIYHPNIDSGGRICLDILKLPPMGSWKPSINISTVLISLSVLMGDPNPDDPLDVDIAKEYKENRTLFVQKARESTLKNAVERSGKPTEPITSSLESQSIEASTSSSSTFASSLSSIPSLDPSPSKFPTDAHKLAHKIDTPTEDAEPPATSSYFLTATLSSSLTPGPSTPSTSNLKLSLSKKKLLSRSHSGSTIASMSPASTLTTPTPVSQPVVPTATVETALSARDGDSSVSATIAISTIPPKQATVLSDEDSENACHHATKPDAAIQMPKSELPELKPCALRDDKAPATSSSTVSLKKMTAPTTVSLKKAVVPVTVSGEDKENACQPATSVMPPPVKAIGPIGPRASMMPLVATAPALAGSERKRKLLKIKRKEPVVVAAGTSASEVVEEGEEMKRLRRNE